MNKLIKICCIPLVAGLVVVSGAFAQEQAPPQIGAVEIFACNFNKGKDMGNLNSVIRRWNQWADQHKTSNYTAFTLTPLYRSTEMTYDVLWLGGWPSGSAMGEGLSMWLKEGQDLQKAFDETVTCDASMMFASMNIRPPKGKPEQGGLVSFSDCTVHKNRTGEEAFAALREWSKFLADKGLDIPSWVLFPVAGETSDAKYSFKYVTGYGQPQGFGKLFEAYDAQKAQQLFSRLLDCNSDRIYVMNPVRVAAGQ